LWKTDILHSDSPYIVERPAPVGYDPISLREAWDIA
jgi:hypothetical protein